MILALRRYRKLAFAGVGLALLVIAALILIPRQGVEVVRFQISDPEFISSRDIIYYGAAEAFPLMSASGFGPETFQQAFPLKSRFVTPVKSVGGWHNDIIQAFLEGGVIALLAYLWMVIAAIRHVFRRARDDDDPWVVGGRWGIAVATAGVALSAMLCNVITVPLVIMAQAVLWGLAVGKIDIHVQAPDSRGSL